MFQYGLFLFFYLSISVNCEKLIFVETHFRNGARAPLLMKGKETDYLKEEWDNPGELTGVGERMQYLLGFRNRLRYITDNYNFLSEKYDAHELLMLSTATNYTLVSASAQLQGLYPMDSGNGEYLTEEQEKYAVPGVNIDAPEIQEEIEKLDNCSLPNSMTVIPVHMLHQLEKRMVLIENEGCIEKTNEVKKSNLEQMNELTTQVKDFNTNYAKKLNIFYGYSQDKTYDFEWINDFCECLKADYTDDRSMKEFKTTGIDYDKLENACSKIRENNLKYYYFGDKNGDLATMESSRSMEEMLSYMQKRIDADIKGEKIEEKYEDFSRPKMLLISSEGNTLSAHQIFLINTFGLGNDKYRHPEYADQISYEVTRDNKKKENSTYTDYTVNYYFNDEVILTTDFQNFMDKINKKIWSKEAVDDYCQIKNEEEKTNVLLIIVIAWSAVVLILIVVAIVLCYKVYKKKSNLKDDLEGLTDN